MKEGLARREFLRGRFKGSPDEIRPPFAVREKEFRALCQSAGTCDACFKECPTSIISMGKQGRPKIEFGQKICTFCGQCAAVCKTGALDSAAVQKWTTRAHILPSCLSLNGVVCRSCGDQCDENAIAFKLMVGGRSAPLVDEENCTGCGACLTTCPTHSIEMKSAERQQIKHDEKEKKR